LAIIIASFSILRHSLLREIHAKVQRMQPAIVFTVFSVRCETVTVGRSTYERHRKRGLIVQRRAGVNGMPLILSDLPKTCRVLFLCAPVAEIGDDVDLAAARAPPAGCS
jgi:hypothetical protein